MSAPFTATKFGREPEQRICDEDCAESLRGDRFEIPFPAVAKNSDAENLRTMRDALQKAWIVFDSLRTYRTEDELLEIIGSDQFATAREAVSQAVRCKVGGQK